ncbi:MAG: dolichyl-phosphate-mannose-protein mannosyltransferase [Parcubacteria group bacterium Gr01-1014_38]|nr:MAG: dolichyl-phosphate-mannose-protein mannosyltransferase [Parcubacteria group bacterium Gr01-1014_38]
MVLVPRLAGLGTSLTIDEPLWIARGAKFIEGLATLDVGKTFTNIHPGVTTAWLAGVADQFQSLAASQGAIAFAVSCALFVSAYLLVKLTSFWVGLAMAAALALDPFLVAHSRVVHTDALLALFLLLTTLLLMLYQRTRARRYLVMSGVTAGFVLLTKLHGAIFLVGCLLLLRFSSSSLRSWIRLAAVWALASIITIIALWPALWVPTKTNIDAFYKQAGISLGEARGRGGEERWWYYPREFLFRTTPVVTVLAPIGMLTALAHMKRRARRAPQSTAVSDSLSDLHAVALTVFLLAAGYAGVISVFSTKSDRWILILFLAADLLAMSGASALGGFLGRMAPSARPWAARAVVAGLFLVLNAWEVQRLHPYPLAHYNRLFPIRENRKLGWGEGLEHAAEFLNAQPDAGVPVVSYYPRVLAKFYHGQVERLVRSHEPGFRYVVLYRSMFERSNDSYETAFLQRYLGRVTPLSVVTINGLPYAWVYENQDQTE